MKDFDKEQIKNLIETTEMEARQGVFGYYAFQNQVENLKKSLDELDFSKSWMDVCTARTNFDALLQEFNKEFDFVNDGLMVQRAAKKAAGILDAGFDFSRIIIGGVEFYTDDDGELCLSCCNEDSIPF